MEIQKTRFGGFFVDLHIIIVYYVELTNINNIMNKYEKWYKNITEAAQNRVMNEYSEIHHILPRSLGGSDDKSNLTNLTAREHFICHWLLTKIYPSGEEHWKMINAFRMMRAENSRQTRYKTKITARVYAYLKEEYSILQSSRVSGENNPNFGKHWTQEQKDAHSKKIKGRVQPLEEKLKQVQSMIGKKRLPFNEEWKINLSKNHKSKQPGFNGTMSDETKQKMREKALGRKQSADTIQKKADAIRGSKREKKQCPHCQQLIAVNGYARWHGDNCKKKC